MKVAVRVLVFYLLMWVFIVLLGGTLQAITSEGILSTDSLWQFLPQWAPGLAGLAMLLLFRKDGLRLTWFDPAMPWWHWLVLFALPLALGAVVYGLGLLAGPVIGIPLTLVLVVRSIFGAVGEELGWRAYLHKRLAPEMNGLWSSLLVGVLWSTMHVHFFAGGPVFFALVTIAFIALSVVMYALLAEYKFNVLGASLFHLGINVGSTLVATTLAEDLSLAVAALFATVHVLAAVAIVARKRELFFATLPADGVLAAA